jgi:hypothetical protein
MTPGEIATTVLSLISVGIAVAALALSGRADRRDREAIVVVRKVWSRQYDRSFIIVGTHGRQSAFVDNDARARMSRSAFS